MVSAVSFETLEVTPNLKIVPHQYSARAFIRRRDEFIPIFKVDQSGRIHGVSDLLYLKDQDESQFNFHHIIPLHYWKKPLGPMAIDGFIQYLDIPYLQPFLKTRNSILNQIILPVDLHQYINQMKGVLTAHGGAMFILSCYMFVLFNLTQFASKFRDIESIQYYLEELHFPRDLQAEILNLVSNADRLLKILASQHREMYDQIRSFYYYKKIQIIQAAREV